MKNFTLKYIALLALFTLVFFTVTAALPLNRETVPEWQQNKAKYNIQVVLKSKSGGPDFWRIVEMGLEMAAKEFSVAYEVDSPNSEVEVDQQIMLVEKAISKKPDAIILASCDYKRLVPVCEKAVKSGIPIIIVDSDVDYSGKTSFVGTDNYQLGQKLGEEVKKIVAAGEKIGVVGHVEFSHTAMERKNGLLDSLKEAGIELAALEYCDGYRDVAKSETRAMLEKDPDIKCMVGLNESSALGICSAIESMKLQNKVSMVVCDSSEEQVKYMESGMVQACVVQNPFNMGYLSVQAAVQVIQGKHVDTVINTGSVTITSEDMFLPEHQKLLFPFTNN